MTREQIQQRTKDAMDMLGAGYQKKMKTSYGHCPEIYENIFNYALKLAYQGKLTCAKTMRRAEKLAE